MKCSFMLFGPKVKFCISYKNHEKGFNIYGRQFIHDLMVEYDHENYEGELGLELEKKGVFLVTQIDNVLIHNSQTMEKVG
jgi:hypothetical protein